SFYQNQTLNHPKPLKRRQPFLVHEARMVSKIGVKGVTPLRVWAEPTKTPQKIKNKKENDGSSKFYS
ncbi:MAG: hypothetical protein R3Y18_04990, partial [Bacillota bacterium]